MDTERGALIRGAILFTGEHGDFPMHMGVIRIGRQNNGNSAAVPFQVENVRFRQAFTDDVLLVSVPGMFSVQVAGKTLHTRGSILVDRDGVYVQTSFATSCNGHQTVPGPYVHSLSTRGIYVDWKPGYVYYLKVAELDDVSQLLHAMHATTGHNGRHTFDKVYLTMHLKLAVEEMQRINQGTGT